MRTIVQWFLNLSEANKKLFVITCIALMCLCGISSLISFVALLIVPDFIIAFLILSTLTGGMSFVMFMIIFVVLFNNH